MSMTRSEPMSVVGDSQSQSLALPPSPPTLVSIDEFDTAPRPNIDPSSRTSPTTDTPPSTVPPPPRPSSPTRPWTPTLGKRPQSPRANRSVSPHQQQHRPRSSSRPRLPLVGTTNGHAPDGSPLTKPSNLGTNSTRTTTDSPSTTPTGSGASTPQLSFDHNTPPPDDPIEYLGGGALYALIGGRMFLPAQELKTLVDVAQGKADLRPDLLAQAESFGHMWIWNEREGTRMTRSRIRYDGDVRLYHPMLRPPHRKLSDLVGTELQEGAYLHIAPPFSSEDVWALQSEMEDGGEGGQKLGTWRPKLVFEPTPPSCHAGQRGWLEKVAPGVHVLSPNHEELLSFYSHPKMPLTHPRLVPTIEDTVQHLLHNVGVGADGQGIIVVRSGRMGCCVATKRHGIRWFPAFYESGNEDKVKDVTGAGNAFIGGYVAGLKLTNEDAYEAVLYGTVSASYVVEQVGLPTISIQDGKEVWNAETPWHRLDALRKRWTDAGLL